MSTDNLKNKVTFAAVLGAGVVVGASGVYIYYRLNKSVELQVAKEFSQEIAHLCTTIENLRKDIEELKSCQVETLERAPVSSKNLSRTSSKTSVVTDFISVKSKSSEEDDEFFDVTSENEEQVTGSDAPWETSPVDDDAQQLFERVDLLLDGNGKSQRKAYNILLDRENEFAWNAEFLWRLAKASRMTALVYGAEDEPDKKKELTFQAFEYAKKALTADSANPESHKWYAITLGSKGEYLGVSDKIKDGFTFKKHIDRAAELKPQDPSLHHLLGRFCYEVSVLSWIERKLASTLFTDPPTATIYEAIEHFQKAESLRVAPWKENRLFLAKCYIQMADYQQAIYWLDKAAEVPVSTPDDKLVHKELIPLRKNYTQYRS